MVEGPRILHSGLCAGEPARDVLRVAGVAHGAVASGDAVPVSGVVPCWRMGLFPTYDTEGDPSLRVDCGGISGFARRGPVHLHLSSGEREAHDRLSEQCGFDGIHSGYGGRKDRPYQVSLWQIFRYADPRMLFRQIKMGMYPYLFVCFGKKEEAKPPEDGRRDSGDDGAETL